MSVRILIAIPLIVCWPTWAKPHALADCVNFAKIRERALSTAIETCKRESKENCRPVAPSGISDSPSVQVIPDSQLNAGESADQADSSPAIRGRSIFSDEDMQWYSEECPIVQLWAAGAVNNKSCRRLTREFVAKGVSLSSLHRTLENLIRMNDPNEVAQQLSKYRFDGEAASWAQRCFSIAHDYYTEMLRPDSPEPPQP